MRIKSMMGNAAVCLGVSCAIVLATGCKVDPLKLLSRNACGFLNCDVLFFVDDILPLSGGPIAGGDAAPAEDDGGGGHH